MGKIMLNYGKTRGETHGENHARKTHGKIMLNYGKTIGKPMGNFPQCMYSFWAILLWLWMRTQCC